MASLILHSLKALIQFRLINHRFECSNLKLYFHPQKPIRIIVVHITRPTIHLRMKAADTKFPVGIERLADPSVMERD